MYKSLVAAALVSAALAAEAIKDVKFNVDFMESMAAQTDSEATMLAQQCSQVVDPDVNKPKEDGKEQDPCSCDRCSSDDASDRQIRLFCPEDHKTGNIANFFQESSADTKEDDDKEVPDDKIQTSLALSEWACIASDTNKIDCTADISALTAVIGNADNELVLQQKTVLQKAATFWQASQSEDTFVQFLSDSLDAFKDGLDNEVASPGTTTIRVPAVSNELCKDETEQLTQTIEDRIASIKAEAGLVTFITEQACLRQEAELEAAKEDLEKEIEKV